MNNKFLKVGLVLVFLFCLSACGGGYYKVTDPSTEKTYYSEEVKQEKGGAVKLLDANTGSSVTLQNSEVTEINKEEFKANTKKE